jgi:hypothetical protein
MGGPFLKNTPLALTAYLITICMCSMGPLWAALCAGHRGDGRRMLELVGLWDHKEGVGVGMELAQVVKQLRLDMNLARVTMGQLWLHSVHLSCVPTKRGVWFSATKCSRNPTWDCSQHTRVSGWLSAP